jgi:uncharacterized protein (TIGR04255 family)
MPVARAIQEVIIASHFQTPLPLQVMDLADWVGHFSEFPIVQQLPALARANLPVPGAPMAPFQFLAEDMLPRMLVRSRDGRFSIQLQNDRFALGWQRTEPIGEPADYPGFEQLSNMWSDTVRKFEDWTQGRFRQRPQPRLIELSYVNAARLERDGRRKRLSEVFKFVQPAGRSINMFTTNWAEPVFPAVEGKPPTGVISCMVGLGVAPPALQVLGYNFTGLSEVAADNSKDILKEIHVRIREIYLNAIIPDAE